MLKRQELQDQERKFEEDIKVSGEAIDVVKNLLKTLREGGSKMTLK